MPEWAAALVSCLLGIFSALLGMPIAVLLVEVVAATVWPRRRRAPLASSALRPRVAVLVPAHNESKGLLPTIEAIRAQLGSADRLLVVADNCSDDTAAVAVAAGAEVTARTNLQDVGKGYALDWGIRHLRANPPDVVVVVDADCRLAGGVIDQLATTSAALHRPVQALYLMTAPGQPALNFEVAEFAWRIRNWVRPLGLRALNLPCQLMGTGMAFPWDVIRCANLASGHLTEDLKLGLDLARAGHPPYFCPSALVTSHFPRSTQAADTQRQRWEHGHISTLLTVAPMLGVGAVLRPNASVLALALDAMVPPLALLATMAVGMTAVATVAVYGGFSSVALSLSLASLAGLVCAVFLSWLTHGRDLLPARAWASLTIYAVRKLGFYSRLLTHGPVKRWHRTDRDS
jgi:cellulose synthase/poly-beta-1,6-N-acetylglucosamine synthase-like glycosyltransferase